MAAFTYDGWRLAYTEFGVGPAPVGGRPKRRGAKPVVIAHGVLLSQRVYWPLARRLAAEGHHVVTVDLLGHGESDRPREVAAYSISSFANQLEALLDHLELPEAALFGTSMGANSALEVALRNPRRVRGLVLEMPVLEQALVGGATLLTPLMLLLKAAGPAADAGGSLVRLLPRRLLPHYLDALLEPVRNEPSCGASVLHGLFYGCLGPSPARRSRLTTPALVIGHRYDPLHPYADAARLAGELPNGRLVEARSLFELRLRPERLVAEIVGFLREAWGEPEHRPLAAAG